MCREEASLYRFLPAALSLRALCLSAHAQNENDNVRPPEPGIHAPGDKYNLAKPDERDKQDAGAASLDNKRRCLRAYRGGNDKRPNNEAAHKKKQREQQLSRAARERGEAGGGPLRRAWLAPASRESARPDSFSSWMRCMDGFDTSMRSRQPTSSVPHWA